MISQTTQYALRAMLCLAKQGPGDALPARDLARQARVSPGYLAAVLRRLVRVGLLKGRRGRGGGFRLARPASRIRIADLMETFEDVSSLTACPFGLSRCQDDQPCPVHAFWKPIRSAYLCLLEDVTLEDLRRAPKKKTRKAAPRRRRGQAPSPARSRHLR